MHFIGGFSIAVSFVLLLEETRRNGFMGQTHKIIMFLFVISLVSLAAVLWEFGEFSLDRLFYFNTQLSLEDTLGDIFLGLLGGVFGFLASYPWLTK